MRLLATLALLAFASPVAAQATFTVTTTADTPDAAPGDGLCADAAGACSLRAAVSEANALAGPDTVVLPAGVFLLTRLGLDDTNDAGDLDVASDLVIAGAGADQTFLDARALRDSSTVTRPADRVLDVLGGASAEVRGVTVRNGGDRFVTGGAVGGGIRNRGTLVLRDAAVVNNNSTLDGGGLWTSGSLIVDRSLVAGNRAGSARTSASSDMAGSGGGIYANGTPPLVVSNSTVSGNAAGNGRYDIMTLSYSLPGTGGGIYASALTLSNSTVTLNVAGVTTRPPGGPAGPNAVAAGGGLAARASSPGTVRVIGSVVARNIRQFGPDDTADCSGIVLSSLGRNVFSNNGGCTARSTDVIASPFAPLLEPLADNGGPTLTHALPPGSPARGAGSCTDAAGAPVAVDQRLFPRAAPCDAGAFEADVAVAEAPGPARAGALRLSAAMPNPARGQTALVLSAGAPRSVTVTLVDALGRTVRTLLDAHVSGDVRLDVDTAGLAPGVYAVRVAPAPGEASGRAVRFVTVVR